MMGESYEKSTSEKSREVNQNLQTEDDAMKMSANEKELNTFAKNDQIDKIPTETIADGNNEGIEVNGEEIAKIAGKSGIKGREGREVKPKKIPIGGIKMPGFFTKGKQLRTDSDGADGELLENDNGKNNHFKKLNSGEETIAIIDRLTKIFSSKPTTKNCKTELQDGPPKKGLLNAIKLPIATMIPKKKTDKSEDVESGIGPETKAGLASMETLDDSLKDQDTVDRAVKSKSDGTFETVKLTEEKNEKAENHNLSYFERIRMYKCSIDDMAITAGIVIFILLVGIICVFSFTGGGVPKATPLRDGLFVVATTACGPVEGLKEDGSFSFRGIPYASSPIGERRWKLAQFIEHIDDCWNGTFQAHNVTEFCSQILSNGTIIGVEDCLTLDVITPHIRYDNPVPVIVLIGAESLLGGSPTVLRPSARYARLKDVIYVRPNFRMGPLGFLALDILSKSTYPSTSGNYGLSDILAALKWIQVNIAHFGGDPKSVVLLGHKAGGTLVSTLISSPLAKDLYSRAWVASGASIFPRKSLSDSERVNNEYLTQIQCKDIICLKNATVEQILEAVPDTWRYTAPDLPAFEENSSFRHEWLVLDGVILQNHPADMWIKEFQKPFLVLGTTAHESHSEKLKLKKTNWSTETVQKHIEQSKFGNLGLANAAIKRYNATYSGLVAMISDIRTICPLLIVARQMPSVPFYVVTQIEPEKDVADADADIQAIMGRYEPHNPQQRRYFSTIQQLFYHWVSHGEMKQYDPRRKVLIVEQDALSSENYPNCDFWISQDIVPRYGRID